MKKLVVALAVSLTCLASCSVQTTSQRTDSTENSVRASDPRTVRKLVSLTDEYIEETLPRAPLNAMFFGDNRFNHLWPNNLTDEFIQEDTQLHQRYLNKLAQIDRRKLFGQDRLTYDIFAYNLRNALKSNQFDEHLLPLNPFIFSPHNLLVQLGAGASAQPLNSVQDFDNFIQRMRGFVAWMSQARQNMRKGIEKGVVLPRTVVESMLPQLEAQILERPEQSPFFTPLNNARDALPAREFARLQRIYTRIIKDEFVPAYADMAAFLKNEYLQHARSSHGMVDLPNGKAWYQFMINTHITWEQDAEQIHQIGLREVSRIQNEMRGIAEEVGFKGNLSEFFTYLDTDPQFYFSSPEQVIQAYEEVKVRVGPLLPPLFDTIPQDDYIVRSYPQSQAQSAPGASYIPAALDGSRPGVFFANAYHLRGQPRYGVETLSLREAVPGRHLQISLQHAIDALPRIRKQHIYTVYTEGWALYAEGLGKELGMFTDPYQYFGKLNAELLGAIRLVVDTGIHAKGWTRDQAIQFMLDNTNMAESVVTAEVERYLVMPGQALLYKMGELKIREMRHDAEKALGSRFDIRQFHNLILLDGPLPMPLLEQKVKRWVNQQ